MAIEQKYRNANLGTDERVSDLLALMSVEEKVAQLHGIWTSDLIDMETKQFQPDKAREAIPHGTGHVTRIGTVSMLPPQQSAELANRIQRHLIEETRLGIPAIVHEETCAGYLAKEATTFPQSIGLAATWEPALVEEMAATIRRQMRAVGAHQSLAPVVDVSRDPRWGRIEETYGEDPFLVAALGTAYVRGLQTDDWSQGILATAKHFIGYSLPEGGLNWAPSHITPRLLREVYAMPFAALIKEANVASVMNGYQEIDGIPCGSSPELLIDLLRGELGFDGTLLSDYFAINMLLEYHHLTETKAGAARIAMQSGIDVELPGRDCYGDPLLQALESGDIHIDLIDAAVTRLLRQKIQLGIFEQPYVDTARVTEVYEDPAALDLSRELAAKSLVLLKNDASTLPLNKSLKRIAVIGPSADDPRLLQGDYHYPAHFDGVINHTDTMEAPTPGGEQKITSWSDHIPPTATILQSIRDILGDGAEVLHETGCNVRDDDRSQIAAAVDAARQSDVAIIVVGDKSGLGLDNTTGEAVDRATLELPGVQQDLILAVAATDTPVVVVSLNGRPPVLTEIVDQVEAILLGWLPAQEGGRAIAAALFGDVNPGGKLPVSLPRHVGQIPAYYNHKPSGGRSHWHGSYVDMNVKPLYPFGYGLSYTSFEYSNLTQSHTAASANDTVTLTFELTNTGSVAGEEVVQVYIADPVASVTRPVKQLKGFKRVHLDAGAKAKVSVALPVAHFAFYDRHMHYIVEPGTVQIMIGTSSQDICLTAAVEIDGTSQPVEPVFTTQIEVTDA